jgi:hypothetical protein
MAFSSLHLCVIFCSLFFSIALGSSFASEPACSSVSAGGIYIEDCSYTVHYILLRTFVTIGIHFTMLFCSDNF